jgi:NodT family efflux transporter outer membrane factor (OMF) lipoprotein
MIRRISPSGTRKTWSRWVTLCAAVVLFSSCNPAPKYARPPVQAPTAFKEAVPQEYKEGNDWKIAQPGDDKIRGKWWEIYGDAQLNALEEQVQVSNQTIAGAEANFRVARSLVTSVRSALFPVLSGAPSYSNSRTSQTTRGRVVGGSSGTAAGGTSSTVLNDFTLPFEVSYTADLWHRVRNALAANTYQAQASSADVATALLTIQAELAQNYFQVRALDSERGILQDSVQNYRQTLELTMSRFRGGIASDEDVSQAQTQLDSAIAQATDLGVARAQFEHAIGTLMGKPPATFSLAVAPFKPNPPAVPVALPSMLLERRPDIAAAERRVAAANAEIGVARAAYYPNLSLSAALGYETSHFTQWFNWPSRFWSVGPQLAGTILDGGARRALNEQAQAAYDQTVANYRQTVLSVFQSVEDNLSTLRILSQEIGEQQTAVRSANHFLDLSLTRYKGGVDSYLNVISAQTAVLTNRETELTIQLRRMNASVGLILALGGGWDSGQLPGVQDLRRKSASRPVQGAESLPVPSLAAPNPPLGAPSSGGANLGVPGATSGTNSNPATPPGSTGYR